VRGVVAPNIDLSFERPQPLARLRCAGLPTFVLLGASLTFFLEPMMGRQLTTRFGSGFHVWNTCMMFYSGALFLSYAYAYLVAPRLGAWHLLLVAAGFAWFASGTTAGSAEPSTYAPALDVLSELIRSVALPFCVLATTSVVAQHWLASSGQRGSEDPYYLYAASNAGSLIGLLGYPLLIEPLFGLGAQEALWTTGFGVYALLAVVLVPRRVDVGLRPSRRIGRELDSPPVAAPWGRIAYWFALSVVPAVALLGVTNLLANGMGSIPLVWVAPLAVYLTSFILAFRRRPDHRSFLRRNWPELAVVACIALTLNAAPLLYLLLAVCLAGHSELHRLRPASRELGFYYLVLAAGGWAGTAFVGLAAPRIFADLHEWPLALVVLATTLIVGSRLWPSRDVAPEGDRRHRFLRALVYAVAAGTIVNLGGRAALERFETVTYRNLYGTYRITHRPAGLGGEFDSRGVPIRYLLHGGTVHGLEAQGGPQRGTPIGYYHPNTPVGQVLTSLESGSHVAVLGLGSGAAAAFLGAEDEITFYELDPEAEAIARRHFSFLDATAGRVRVVVGDGRLGLQSDPLAGDGNFDLIFMDAFSGDAIPSHLMTRQAIELYLRKLAPDGLLFFHVSSRFFDFYPVLTAARRDLGLHAAYATSQAPLEPLEMPAKGFLFARSGEPLAPFLAKGWRSDESLRAATPWTDDYVNVLAPLWSHLRTRVTVLRP